MPMNMPTPRRSSSNFVTGGAAGAAGCAGACAQETFRDKSTPAAPVVDKDMKFLRFMESSRPRNSTLLDALIAALLALAALVAATGGFEIALGSLTLRSHSAWRVLAIALIPIGIRAWQLR